MWTLNQESKGDICTTDTLCTSTSDDRGRLTCFGACETVDNEWHKFNWNADLYCVEKRAPAHLFGCATF